MSGQEEGEAIVPAADEPDPYANSVFIIHKEGETDPFLSIFCTSPDEARSRIDRIIEGEEIKEIRRRSAEERNASHVASRAVETYATINISQWVLIDTIGKTLAKLPHEKFSGFVQSAKDISTSVENYKGYLVYESLFPAIRENVGIIIETHRLIDALSIVRPALLMAFVASFDSFLADFLRQAIRESSQPLTYSDRKLTLREVLAAESIESLKDDIVDDEVEQVLRESHAKQVDYIRKSCHFDPFENYSRKMDYLELFERRNLIAHGIKTFNESYKRNMTEYGFPPRNDGKEVKVSPSYLRDSLDILLEFSLLCDFAYQLKRCSQDEVDDVFYQLNGKCVDLMSSGRVVPAKWILAFLVSIKKAGLGEYAKKMITLNLANAQFMTGDDESAENTLKRFDWKASADEFQMCEASIRGDVNKAVEMLPGFSDEKRINRTHIREWPAFSRVRDAVEFRRQFREVFGEPLVDAGVQSILNNEDTVA